MYDEGGRGLDGWGSAQETIANFTPKKPLLANQTYTVEVQLGGITDLSGNRVDVTKTWTFSTGAR